MSKYCRICRNTDCGNHGRDITFHGDGWVCNYIPVPTNADRIRAMSDEELADFIQHIRTNTLLAEALCVPVSRETDLEFVRQPVKDGEGK